MTSLSPSDVIQINATVIAGLLILLTLQSVNNPVSNTLEEFLDKSIDAIKGGDPEYQRLSQLSRACDYKYDLGGVNFDHGSSDSYDEDVLQLLGNFISHEDCVEWVREYEIQYFLRNKQFELTQSLMNDTSFQKLTLMTSLSSTIVSTITMIMILPFAFSALLEIKNSLKMDQASKISINLLLVGFIGLIIGMILVLGFIYCSADSSAICLSNL